MFNFHESKETVSRWELYHWLSSRVCGCGIPEELAETTLRYLRTLHLAAEELSDEFQERLRTKTLGQAGFGHGEWATRKIDLEQETSYWFVIYGLDSWGLLEHGTSITSSWLTALGFAVLAALEEEKKRDNFESIFDYRKMTVALETGECEWHPITDSDGKMQGAYEDKNGIHPVF